MFAQILPPGNESEFFSLFEITDRGSSFIGPLVAGALINLNKNDPRTGFIVGLILLIFAIPVVWSVNMDKAQKDIRSRSEVSFDSALMQNDEHMIEVRMGPA